ncbi:indolepyruvate oxidoreductase subunit beta family protein [Aquincola sp. MAHUQ-54]|uniref:Indolepyruvate oxidoreductase subunit beta family protein n=1 Tax=Aquincola agrisoli TaxID=3119538 RepID=A0AAW9QHH2_9BURK
MTTRSVCVLVAAMGGEGGGVLADWIIDAAQAHDFPVQSTSVPGVAQRTGATTYYLEIFPVPRAELAGRQPVMSLTPNPGNVDVVAASELVEAGRVLQNGFVNPQRTVLVASTHREYAVSEKAAMGDGRYDVSRVLKAAEKMAQRAFLFDMRAIAWRHGTVINTVMFGAMAGSGVLPFSREACEDAIRRSGKAVEASLRGFAAGFEHAASGAANAVPGEARRATATPSARVLQLPAALHEIAAAGVRQVTDYQDEAYARLYLDRVEALCGAPGAEGAAAHAAVREAARYLALWMSYEDVIRVADLKTRRDRLERVRREVGAREGEPLRLTEYLKPGLDEICSILPTGLAARLRRRYAGRAHALNVGLHMRTDTVGGFALLCVLRSLRRWRPRTSRYTIEQQAIDRWLAAVGAALPRSAELAVELALCGNLVKGYGETSERGHRNLAAILDDVQTRGTDDAAALTERVRSARQAALADPEGRALAGSLGLPRPEPKAQPIRIVRKAAAPH